MTVDIRTATAAVYDLRNRLVAASFCEVYLTFHAHPGDTLEGTAARLRELTADYDGAIRALHAAEDASGEPRSVHQGGAELAAESVVDYLKLEERRACERRTLQAYDDMDAIIRRIRQPVVHVVVNYGGDGLPWDTSAGCSTP